jgi:RNA polymerase sigma factor (sigma-70 family)
MKAVYDSTLISAASAGNLEAVEQLLLQSSVSITNFARKFCATPQDVEDAVQETLWVVYQKIGTLRAAAAFTSWIFKVVRNECYRLLKLHRDDQEIDCYRLELVDDNPELYRLLKHDIVKAVAELPEHYRQVLLMRDIQGLTAPEVADALDISIETVKSRLHRARNTLREQLHHWQE